MSSTTSFPPLPPFLVSSGGTGSTVALTNGKIMSSSGGTIVESSLTVTSITPEAPSVNKWVFVSQYGNDTTGDGTYDHPYATTTKALSIISDASTTNRYGIHIRGTVSEATIYLKPYVWYFGDTWGCSRLNATSTNAIQLSPGAFTSGNSRCGMTNVYMTGSTGIDLDFIAQTASGSHVVEMDNLGVNGAVSIKSNNTNQYFQWRGSFCFSNFTFHGCLGFCSDAFIAGNVLVDNGTAGVVGQGLNLINCLVGGNVTLTGDGTHSNVLQLTACTVAGSTTVTGASSTLMVDGISLSAKASVSVSSGGALTRTTDAYAIGYAPTVSGNWLTQPNNVYDALDIAASEIASLPVWTKYSVSHTALQAASTTNNIQLFSLPAKSVMHAVIMKQTTAFAGTLTYTLSVGITGSLAKYLSAYDVTQAVSDSSFTQSGASVVVQPEDFGSATSIRLAATSTIQNLNQSSAGAVDVYVLTSKLP